VATDKDGNQYTFRVHENADGETIITEANVRTTGGSDLKLSLDSQGRPVNIRQSDNTAADLVYGENDTVKIRTTDAAGNETASAAGIKTDTKKAFVQQRRGGEFLKSAARGVRQTGHAPKGLATCEEIIISITDAETNPDSPLVDSDLSEGCRTSPASVGADVEEVENADEPGRGGHDRRGARYDRGPPPARRTSCSTRKASAATASTYRSADVQRLRHPGDEFDWNLVFPDLSV